MTQDDLARAAHVSLSMLQKIERGARAPSDDTLDAIAAALGLDPARLLTDHHRTDSRVHDAMPALSAAIATYDIPDDGPVRPVHELHAGVAEAVNWRLAAQYPLARPAMTAARMCKAPRAAIAAPTSRRGWSAARAPR